MEFSLKANESDWLKIGSIIVLEDQKQQARKDS